jgi:hypothetical protein
MSLAIAAGLGLGGNESYPELFQPYGGAAGPSVRPEYRLRGNLLILWRRRAAEGPGRAPGQPGDRPVKRLTAAAAAVGALVCLSSTAFAAESATTIAARQKFFGKENVDAKTGALPRDKVILSWLTNTTYAVALRGRLALFDTYATRLEVAPGRTNFVIKDIVDLKPEAIFLGHGHFDHADNAAYIAAKSGAPIYASAETCPVMQFDLARMKGDPAIQNDPVARIDPNATISCTDVTSAGSQPGSQVVRLAALEPEVCVLGFRHLHSVLVPHDDAFPTNPVQVTVDPRDAALFPKGTPLTPTSPPQPGQMDLRSAIGYGANPGGPIAIGYQFILRDFPKFTILWTNSNGALKEGKGNGYDGTPADGERITQMLRNLPSTDVFMGIVSTANYPNNQLRDTVMYSEAVRPRVFVPGHHTTGTIGAEGTSAALYASLTKQFALMEQPSAGWAGFPRSQWPSMRWITDPMDYAKPIVFDPNDKEWARGAKELNADAQRMRKYCQ